MDILTQEGRYKRARKQSQGIQLDPLQLEANMRCVIVLSALVAVALAQPLVSEEDLNQWELFKVTYEKEYDSDNEEYRKQVFLGNLKKIQEHNAKYERGESTYTMAVNKLADLTSEEFHAMYTNLKVSQKPSGREVFHFEEDLELPKTVDWRKKGAVTGVKDQGQCGSCWSFSATGGIEGQHFLKTKKLVSLSEQNLVDCAVTQGCSGSDMDTAFAYVIKNKGIDTEESYPYTGTDTGSCKYKPKKSGATISSFVDIPSGNEKALQNAVAKVGPIPVAIDATDNFQFYSSGVFSDSTCGKSEEDLDHGVLAVGYGTDKKGGAYWLVKNSWGSSWGLQGYIMMSRNKNNQCGIATMSSYPVV